MPINPKTSPHIHTNLFFDKVAIEESKIEICRNITAIPNFPECCLFSSLVFS